MEKGAARWFENLVRKSLLAAPPTIWGGSHRRVIRKRGAPKFLRSDNGSEFTAQEAQIWLDERQTGPAFIPPGQP